MRKMVYSCRVKCHDGVIRTFQKKGYFLSTRILRHCLSTWDGCSAPNGGFYEYFETDEQRQHNETSPILPKNHRYPLYSVLQFGKGLQDYFYVSRRLS